MAFGRLAGCVATLALAGLVATAEASAQTRIGQAAIDAYEDAAAATLPAARDVCLAGELISTGSAPAVKRANPQRMDFPSSSGTSLTATEAGGGAIAFGVRDSWSFDWPARERELQMLRDLPCRAAGLYGDVAASAADPEFDSWPIVTYHTPIATENDAADATFEALAVHVEHGRTQLQSLERYRGAVAAGDETGVHHQARWIALEGRDSLAAAGDAAAAMRGYADELAADPAVRDPVATQAEVERIAAIYDRVRASGFTDAEEQPLVDDGMHPGFIEMVRDDFAATDIASAPVGRSAAAIVEAMAAALDDGAEGVDALVDDAWAVAEATNHPPAAGFSIVSIADAGSGQNLRFTVDEPDPDGDPASYEWSFDDGGTAQGEQVWHRFATPGEHTATLTVTDDFASATETRSFTVGGRVELDIEAVPHDYRGAAVVDLDAGDGFGIESLSDGDRWAADSLAAEMTLRLAPTGGGHLTALSCDDAGSARPSTADAAAGTITARADAGETVRCTAKLAADAAKAIVRSEVLGPSRDPFQRFLFQASDGPPDDIRALGHGEETSFDLWPTGALHVGRPWRGWEPDYEVAAVDCDDGASAHPSSGDPIGRAAYFRPDPGETVRCTLKWRPLGLVSPGPLRRIRASDELECGVWLAGDNDAVFFDCGTVLRAAGTTFAHGEQTPLGTGFTAGERTGPTGTGTRADPLTVVTRATAGATGVSVRQVDSYVTGDYGYRTSVTLTNTGDVARSGQLYRAGECMLEHDGTVAGFGESDAATGAVACRTTPPGEAGQQIRWTPVTAGSHRLEGEWPAIASAVKAGEAFDDSCVCTPEHRPAGGLSWAYSLAPGESATFEHFTTVGSTDLPVPGGGDPGPEPSPTATPQPETTPTPTATATAHADRHAGPVARAGDGAARGARPGRREVPPGRVARAAERKALRRHARARDPSAGAARGRAAIGPDLGRRPAGLGPQAARPADRHDRPAAGAQARLHGRRPRGRGRRARAARRAPLPDLRALGLGEHRGLREPAHEVAAHRAQHAVQPLGAARDRPLAQRARALGERADRLELVPAAQPLRVRHARAQRRGELVGGRHAAAGDRVDERRVHAVAGGEEAVLLEHLGRDRLALRRALERLAADQALHERGERRGVAHARLRVHDPHLDRAEPRLQPHVPPQERRLGDRVAADQHVDGLDVVLVGGEAARRARAREGLEDRGPRGGEPAVAALPERRVGRQRQQQRQLLAQPVERPHGGVLVGHRDMHVQRERRLAARELAHRRVEELVARAGGDLGVLPARERVGAGHRGGHPHRVEPPREPAAQRGQLDDRVGDGRVRRGRQLDGGAMRLRRGVLGDLAVERLEHLLGARGGHPAVRVEEHDLLLDADGPRRLGSRAVPFRPSAHGSTHVSFAPPF